MKRSEMLKIIWDTLHSTEIGVEDFDGLISERILHGIEEAGMLPPKTNFKDTDGIVYKASVWDDEDEK